MTSSTNKIEDTLEKLHPQVYVYRGAFKNNVEFLEKIKANDSWVPWWVFGQMMNIDGQEQTQWDHFPSRSEWDAHIESIVSRTDQPTTALNAEIEELFYQATKHYIEEQGISLTNWMHQKPSINVYKEDGGVSNEMSMHYHTDYQQEKEDARGYKFRVTCTMYLNDDYTGGELAFKIRENVKDATNDINFDYKPQAGDILVFPSGVPFYHGVKTLEKGDRYFIRTFWLEFFAGTPGWLAGEAKHGPEKWAELEKEREETLRHSIGTVY